MRFFAPGRFSKSFTIGHWKFSLDPSLFLIVAVISWLLSTRYFPVVLQDLSTIQYWVIGTGTTLLVIISILWHEIGHALAARYLELEIDRIHMFALGGMAILKHRMMSPFQEFLIGISGPLASMLLGGIWWLLSHIGVSSIWVQLAVLLTNLNLLVALFNLIPIYPLDGGRILRSIIWKLNQHYYQASVLTYRVGALLIVAISLMAIVMYVQQNYRLSIWIGIGAAYLAYTALKGKYRLVTIPSFSEMIWQPQSVQSPSDMVQAIHEYPQISITDTIIPVIFENKFVYTISGKNIKKLRNDDDIYNYLEEPDRGSYIDINDISTYDKSVSFNAKWLPILQGNQFIGLCDSAEIRFWLTEIMKHRGKPDLRTYINKA